MIFAGLLYLGLFALAASMGRHEQLLPARWRPAERSGQLRIVAWLLILASLVAALWSPDWATRLLTWIGLAAVAGGIVLLSLTYGVRWARLAAMLAVSLVVAGFLLS